MMQENFLNHKKFMPSRIDILITDFDGVVLDSESAKFLGFSECFSIYPKLHDQIISYLREKDHLNRYQKFEYIFENLIGMPYTPDIQKWITIRCNECVYNQVIVSPQIPGVVDFLKKSAAFLPICVVSGTPVDQLTRIITDKGLASLFAELHGIPPKKSQILADILNLYHIDPQHAVYIGDRNSDQTAAKENQIHFIARGSADAFEEPVIHHCMDFLNIETILKFDHEKKSIFLQT